MKSKVDLFREGLEYLESNIDESTYALEWDFTDSELLELSGIKRCPVCGGMLDCDDGVIYCLDCDWELR